MPLILRHYCLVPALSSYISRWEDSMEEAYSPFTRSVQKVSSHIIRNIETFIEEDTRYKKHYT